MRADREQLYTTELPYLSHDGLTDLRIGVISTAYYTSVTPQDTFNLAGPSRR